MKRVEPKQTIGYLVQALDTDGFWCNQTEHAEVGPAKVRAAALRDQHRVTTRVVRADARRTFVQSFSAPHKSLTDTETSV